MSEYLLYPEAEADLAHVYEEGIQRFGVIEADKYQIELHEKFAFLAKFSGLGTGLSLHAKTFRRYSYKAHLILFEPTGDGVNILRILHGSSNYMKHLEDGS